MQDRRKGRGNCSVNVFFSNIQSLKNSENLICRTDEKRQEHSCSSKDCMSGLYSEEKCKRWRYKEVKTEHFRKLNIDRLVSVKEKGVIEN
jgi:hypothetical protein